MGHSVSKQEDLLARIDKILVRLGKLEKHLKA